MDYKIRELELSEIGVLDEFLYLAIFQRDTENLLPYSVINQPDLKVYTEDFFGKPDDLCYVAVNGDEIIGAVWTRILSGDVKGFGNIDDETPEFAISIRNQYRGNGAGTALMERILRELKSIGYEKVSLAVQKDNYALRMYEKVGFVRIKETEEEFIMVNRLN